MRFMPGSCSSHGAKRNAGANWPAAPHVPSSARVRERRGRGRVIGARLTNSSRWTPSPQSKSAVADLDRFVEWPKPAYTRFRLGEGWGGGSCRGALKCHISRPPPPTPPHKGGGEESGATSSLNLAPMGEGTATPPCHRL